MATDSKNFAAESGRYERHYHHSAFEEFSRDERRPAVLLLGALLIAALFFAIGIIVGQWISDADTHPNAPHTNSATMQSP